MANRRICLYSYTAVTNANGEFHFPKIVRALDDVTILTTTRVNKPKIYMHKAGYIRDFYASSTKGIRYMVPDHSNFDERFKYFISERENRKCYDVEGAHAKYFQSMYEEQKARATTEEEKRDAEYITNWAISQQCVNTIPGNTPDRRLPY